MNAKYEIQQLCELFITQVSDLTTHQMQKIVTAGGIFTMYEKKKRHEVSWCSL